MDGFRTDYIGEQTTPFLYGLARKSLRGQYQPLFAFTGIGASIATGLSPKKHGIWVEFFYDPVNSPFRWTKAIVPLGKIIDAFSAHLAQGRLLRMASTFLAFKISKLISQRSYMPMALLAPINSLRFFNTLTSDVFAENSLKHKTLFDILKQKRVPFRILSESLMRDKEIVDKAMHIDQDLRFLFMQLGDVDTVGHLYGPNSRELRYTLRTIDEKVQNIIALYDQRFDLDVFIFSDHGMVEVNNSVNILQSLELLGLKEQRDFLVFLDSTLARFWVLNREIEARLVKGLQSIPNGTVFSECLFERYQVPKDRKYGDVIWLANPGSIILPNHYQGSKLARGMHGYLPEANGNQAPFILYSKNFTHREIRHVASPMDIFATVATLLELDIPWSIDGVSLTSVS